MRVALPPTFALPTGVPRWRRAAVLSGLIAMTVGSASADETADSKASRLGFRFDPQAHASAKDGKTEPTSPLDSEPLPPGVVRLPKHVVIGQRVPLEPDEMLTPEGRVEVAKKRHLSPLYRVTFGPLSAVLSFLNNPLGGFRPNTPEAMALYEQDQQLRRNARADELNELAELADRAKADAAEAPARPRAKKR